MQEKSEYVMTNLSWAVSTAKHTKYLAHFSGYGKENFPKLNFIQALNLGLKISFCFKGDDFDSDLLIEFFTFSFKQNNNKSSQELWTGHLELGCWWSTVTLTDTPVTYKWDCT